MTRDVDIMEKDLLTHLAKARKPLSLREIATGMRIRRAGRRLLAKLLSHLEKRGEIEQVRAGCYAITEGRVGQVEQRQPQRSSSRSAQVVPAKTGGPSPGGRWGPAVGTITGRLIAHRDGFGFVVPD